MNTVGYRRHCFVEHWAYVFVNVSASCFCMSPHAGDGMVTKAEAKLYSRTLIHHPLAHVLHVHQQIPVLGSEGLEVGDGYPWQHEPVVLCLWVLVLDDDHAVIFIDLE